ncbi:hypothetical protein GE061_000663 [Apolygus lucorum]|uniref:Mediator of RNA polymerase II transcription subunit 7 n=1 Tax=Apolygus lucorum TaxID=248454 RepID=A0A8S9Y4X4_APOLU|nr:hypothetical protein GE061_000663 [Apolygus lucorum]
MGVLDQCGVTPAPAVISNNVEQAAQVCSLPLPPQQFITNYTDDNIKRGRAPRPPPPVHETYSMFGNTFNADDTIIRPLEQQGIKRLYPHNFDRRRELRKLNHSLLVNFLDLLDMLVRCPESGRRTEKVDDLSLLFIHIHHLLNEFRPHQARETLRVMMDLQRRQRIEISLRFQKHLDKVYEMLQQAIHSLPDTSDFDSKLIVPSESFENMDSSNSSPNPDQLAVLDDIMCSIKTKSNGTHLFLRKVTINLSGRYSCEVSADAPSFRTALVSGDMNIVVVPSVFPEIRGMKARYKLGDILEVQCVSKDSRPAANLTWSLNGKVLDSEYVKQANIKRDSERGLETAVSTLTLSLHHHHFVGGRIKVKCTASIHNIYWQTTENSAGEEKPKDAEPSTSISKDALQPSNVPKEGQKKDDSANSRGHCCYCASHIFERLKSSSVTVPFSLQLVCLYILRYNIIS